MTMHVRLLLILATATAAEGFPVPKDSLIGRNPRKLQLVPVCLMEPGDRVDRVERTKDIAQARGEMGRHHVLDVDKVIVLAVEPVRDRAPDGRIVKVRSPKRHEGWQAYKAIHPGAPAA